AFEHVAFLHRANAGRRAGHDQIAGPEFNQAAEIADDFWNAPDLVSEVTALTFVAVDLERDGAAVRMADLSRAGDEANRSGVVEALGQIPRPAGLLGGGLK